MSSLGFRYALTLLALVAFLSGCDDSYEDQTKRLEKFVAKEAIGSGSDYWLVKGSFGVDDRVALVFGYMNDSEACMEIAELLNQRYPVARYSCRLAN